MRLLTKATAFLVMVLVIATAPRRLWRVLRFPRIWIINVRWMLEEGKYSLTAAVMIVIIIRIVMSSACHRKLVMRLEDLMERLRRNDICGNEVRMCQEMYRGAFM